MQKTTKIHTTRYALALAAVMTGFVTLLDATAAAEPFDACKGAFPAGEAGATYEDFDFWIGEWQVVATGTGNLRSVDDVKYIHDGCVIFQQWTQMDDLFKPNGSQTRLRGTSLTGVDTQGRWRQLWTDNAGSNIMLTGGLQADGSMVLASDWEPGKDQKGNKVQIRNIWHWQPMPDGSIHNWGFIQRDSEDGPKTKFFDIIYHRSIVGGPVFNERGAPTSE